VFNLRKNKSFSYKSRFPKETDSDANQVTDEGSDFVAKWKQSSHVNKRKIKGGFSMKILLLILVLLLICMYILENKYM
jgi:hypothetical protein